MYKPTRTLGDWTTHPAPAPAVEAELERSEAGATSSADGLVISPISSREADSALYHSDLDYSGKSDLIRAFEAERADHLDIETGELIELPQFHLIDSDDDRTGSSFLSVSTGTVQLYRTGKYLDRGDKDTGSGKNKNGSDKPKRGNKVAIREWSRSSRSSMLKVLSALDYSVWNGRRIGMVTLTLPSDWERFCHDGAEFYRLVSTWRKRYERQYGKLTAVWKREFQKRGAPHLHLIMPIPAPFERVNDEGKQERVIFKQWLSESWTDVVFTDVAFDDEKELKDARKKHLNAGTGVDISGEGANYKKLNRMIDPKRIAIYFLKKEGGASGESSKEYQNEVPKHWADEGRKVGRWWGFWGLEKSNVEIALTSDEWKYVARTFRRLTRAKGEKMRVTRPRIKNGREVYRKTTVRRYYFKGAGSGFMLINDGLGMAEMIIKIVKNYRLNAVS